MRETFFLEPHLSVCQITTDAGSSHSRTHFLTEAEVYADDMAVSYTQQDTQLVSLLVLLASTSADVRARRVLAAENGMQGRPPVQDWYCQCGMPVHRIQTSGPVELRQARCRLPATAQQLSCSTVEVGSRTGKTQPGSHNSSWSIRMLKETRLCCKIATPTLPIHDWT